ncbi:MAG: J domain-containing protein [Breznakia sp.]
MWYFDKLEIKATKDIKAIKKAYSAVIKKYHPEEYPEEFKEINEAYKQALAYAKGYDPIVLENKALYDLVKANRDKNADYDVFQNAKTSAGENSENEFENLKDENSSEEAFKNSKSSKIKKEKININRKFGKVDEYADEYEEKIEKINELIELLKHKGILSIKNYVKFFKSEQFLKYCYDSVFIKKYIQSIQAGLYKGKSLRFLEKSRRIHHRMYFKNNKKQYPKLYNVFKQHIFNKKLSIVGSLVLMAVAVKLFSVFGLHFEIYYLWIIAIVVFLINIILFKFFRKPFTFTNPFIWYYHYFKKIIIFIPAICIFAVFLIDDDSFGEFRTRRETDMQIEFSQNGDQFDFYRENKKFNASFSINGKEYETSVLFGRIKGFGYDKEDIYYSMVDIDNNHLTYQLYMVDKTDPLITFEDKSDYELNIFYSDDICILVAADDEKTTIYKLSGGVATEVFSYKSEKYVGNMYLMKEKFYHEKEDSNYLWYYDFATGKDVKTIYEKKSIKCISSINDSLFVEYHTGGNNYNGEYEFKGIVENLIDIGNNRFAYINDENLLYVVDSEKNTEVICVDLNVANKTMGLYSENFVGSGNTIILEIFMEILIIEF